MTRTLERTPRADGYWMPGEFEPHAGTWMLWPERIDNWRDGARPPHPPFPPEPPPTPRSSPVPAGGSVRHSKLRPAQFPRRGAATGFGTTAAGCGVVGPPSVPTP